MTVKSLRLPTLLILALSGTIVSAAAQTQMTRQKLMDAGVTLEGMARTASLFQSFSIFCRNFNTDAAKKLTSFTERFAAENISEKDFDAVYLRVSQIRFRELTEAGPENWCRDEKKIFDAIAEQTGDKALRALVGGGPYEAPSLAALGAIMMAETDIAAGQLASKPKPAVAPARTPEAAEKQLELSVESLPSGLYALDRDLRFNVLDSVYYDPKTDQLSLIGHFDPHYLGPGIPYLEHLAVLLETPKPEFSLTWTQDSHAEMEALFNQSLSETERDRWSRAVGELFDKNGKPTPTGELILPQFGIFPFRNGQSPGYGGFAVEPMKMPNGLELPGLLRVTEVKEGSPAAQAGLHKGDAIERVGDWPFDRPVLTVEAFRRELRHAGAGALVTLKIVSVFNEAGQRVSGPPEQRLVTLTLRSGAAPGENIWRDADRYDVLASLYRHTNSLGNSGNVVDAIGVITRMIKSGADRTHSQQMLEYLVRRLGLAQEFDAARQSVQSGVKPASAAYELMLKIAQRLDDTFNLPGGPSRAAYVAAVKRSGNVNDFKPATDALDRALVESVKPMLDKLLSQGLQIPPDLIEAKFHLHPEMQPDYGAVPQDSLLARAMFASDYLCKRLMNRPELRQLIPGYQTGFDFGRAHPDLHRASGDYRLWISVDKMDAPESPDGKVLAFRNVAMRFNIRELNDTGQDRPGQKGGYEDLLTGLWASFEQRYPSLHELREAAKLSAVAHWIRQHNPAAALPHDGRTQWRGPSVAPGLVFFYLWPDPVRGMAKTHETIVAAGGISLTPFPQNPAHPFAQDSSVVDLSGLGDGKGAADPGKLEPVLFSHGAQDAMSSRLYHQIDRIFVPPPHPSAWVADFDKGERNMRAVSLRLAELKAEPAAKTAGDVEEMRKLERFNAVSIQLAQVEKALNALDEKNSDSVREAQKLQAEIEESQKKFKEHLLAFAISKALDTRKFLLDHPDIEKLGEFGDKAKDQADYLEDLLHAQKSDDRSLAALEKATAFVKTEAEYLRNISDVLGSTAAAEYFAAVKEAKELEDVLIMAGLYGELKVVTEAKVDDLTKNTEDSAALRAKLLPLHKKLVDRLHVMAADPQLKGFTRDEHR